MSHQSKAKVLKELQTVWYKRLAKEGFKDIEKSENALHLYESSYFADPRRTAPEVVAAKQTYYQIAGHFLYEHPFKNAFDRKVWGMHAEGMDIRSIAAALKRPGFKDKVMLTIHRLEKEMINKAKGIK